jgi:hypothetical protein
MVRSQLSENCIVQTFDILNRLASAQSFRLAISFHHSGERLRDAAGIQYLIKATCPVFRQASSDDFS